MCFVVVVYLVFWVAEMLPVSHVLMADRTQMATINDVIFMYCGIKLCKSGSFWIKSLLMREFWVVIAG